MAENGGTLYSAVKADHDDEWSEMGGDGWLVMCGWDGWLGMGVWGSVGGRWCCEGFLSGFIFFLRY